MAQEDQYHKNSYSSWLSGLDTLLILLMCAISAVGINPYIYGLYNHEITIPFVKKLLHPELYPGDFLIAELRYFFTFFLDGVAWLVSFSGLSIPTVFFALYLLSLFFSFLAVFKTSLALFGQRGSAYFSLFLFMFAFNTLGDVRSVESMFLERSFTYPILLFSIYFFLVEKFRLSWFLLGLGFILHPLSAAYALALIGFASLFNWRRIGWGRLLQGVMIFVLMALPVLLRKFNNPAPSLHLIHADPNWLELLRLRSWHHLFPTEWAWTSFLFSGLFLLGFILCWRHKPGSNFQHQSVRQFTLAVILLCLAGTVFSEWYPVAIVLQFQFFRSFQLLVFLAILYYGNYFYTEGKRSQNLLENAAVSVMLIGVYYGDNLPKFASFVVIVVAITAVYSYVYLKQRQLSDRYVYAVIGLLGMIAIAASMLGSDLKPEWSFTTGSSADAHWLDVQRWAAGSTPEDAIFIVPPQSSGFRIESERSSYGDWKDGTQMFFNPDYGNEWIRRMRMLGYKEGVELKEGYMALQIGDFQRIAWELRPDYQRAFVVVPQEHAHLHLQEEYSNSAFRVYSLY